jgi:hypothetical protein
MQNLRRGHYDIATDTPGRCKLGLIFDELALASWPLAPSSYFEAARISHNATVPCQIVRLIMA